MKPIGTLTGLDLSTIPLPTLQILAKAPDVDLEARVAAKQEVEERVILLLRQEATLDDGPRVMVLLREDLRAIHNEMFKKYHDAMPGGSEEAWVVCQDFLRTLIGVLEVRL